MVRRLAFSGALLLLAALSSCLEFDGQDVTWVFDAERDRLDVQLVDRGFYVGEESQLFGPPKPGFDSTDEMLGRLLGGERIVALLQSWPFAFPLDDITKEGLETDAEGKPKDLIAATLASHITVRRGDFFRDAKGRVCAWQHVRVKGLAECLAMGDALLRREFADEKCTADFRKWFGLEDEESLVRWQAAMKEKRRWLSHRGSALEFHVPASDEAARRFLERLEAAGRKRADDGAKPTDFEEFAEGARRVGLQVSVDAEGLLFSIGDPEKSQHELNYSPPNDEPHHDVTPLLEKRNVVIRTDVTDETLKQLFAEFRRS